MARKRLGDDPTDIQKDRIKEGLGMDQAPAKKPRKKRNEMEEKIRRDLDQGGARNFYVNKTDELIQKVTVHIPYDVVMQLKKEAFDRRITLSEVIREKLKIE